MESDSDTSSDDDKAVVYGLDEEPEAPVNLFKILTRILKKEKKK